MGLTACSQHDIEIGLYHRNEETFISIPRNKRQFIAILWQIIVNQGFILFCGMGQLSSWADSFLWEWKTALIFSWVNGSLRTKSSKWIMCCYLSMNTLMVAIGSISVTPRITSNFSSKRFGPTWAICGQSSILNSEHLLPVDLKRLKFRICNSERARSGSNKLDCDH